MSIETGTSKKWRLNPIRLTRDAKNSGVKRIAFSVKRYGGSISRVLYPQRRMAVINLPSTQLIQVFRCRHKIFKNLTSPFVSIGAGSSDLPRSRNGPGQSCSFIRSYFRRGLPILFVTEEDSALLPHYFNLTPLKAERYSFCGTFRPICVSAEKPSA